MSHKKQRREEEEEVVSGKKKRTTENAAPSLATSILQQTKDTFVSGLENVEPKDFCESVGKLHLLTSWVVEREIQLKRQARVQAIYHTVEEPQQSLCRHDSGPLFTAATATALLDSGFLSSVEIGKLCLLTGKFFLGHLQLDSNCVWKKIFEVKFDPKENMDFHACARAKSSINSLTERGGRGHSAFFSVAAISTKDIGNEELPIQKPHPASTLNCHNIFFIVLIQCHGEYHAEVLDNPSNIEELMLIEFYRYKVAISCKKKRERIKHLLDRWERGSQLSILSIRMDTFECARLKHSNGYLNALNGYIPISDAGNELLKEFLSDTGEGYPRLESSVSFGNAVTPVSSAEEFWLELTFPIHEDNEVTEDEEVFLGIDMYRCLDYGIDW
eukprot:CAMPEP_0168776978 /NCGR_PEP_ID=MMETSP0725-20121227/6318_1 /TAXON_ID=265536 /ORGANISM="Amphiprora sp., Strain CCMP467" /LENGTH=386 /DNA_ID=CAMNT_0008826679 /DNA_START=202 /DNA_END=1360 /DNA_ORIENTATION=+